MGLEREAHPFARRGQTSNRTRSPRDQGPVERGTGRVDEGIGDDLRRLANRGEGVLAQGETEGEACAGGPANTREPEPDEPVVRDALPTEILHGPLERASDSLERRGDFRGPVVVQRDSNSVVQDKASAPGRSSRSSGRNVQFRRRDPNHRGGGESRAPITVNYISGPRVAGLGIEAVHHVEGNGPPFAEHRPAGEIHD